MARAQAAAAGTAAGPTPPPGDDAASSRLCVKNIPKHVEDKRLREHFAAKGEVTDCKILRTKDGRSRQMAFVGFKTAAEATRARKFFHNSFLDTSRMKVDFAYKAGDEQLPRAWSKYSKGSSAFKKLHADEEAAGAGAGGGQKDKDKKPADTVVDEMRRAIASDPKLQEFMAVMAPRSKAKIWSNDDAIAGVPEPAKEGGRGAERPAFDDDGSDDDGEYQDLAGGDAEETDSEGTEAGVAGGSKGGTGAAAMSDLDYLKARTKNFDEDEGGGGDAWAAEDAGTDGEAEGASQGGGSDDEEDLEAERATKALFGGGQEDAGEPADAVDADEQADVSQTGRVFVRNLPYAATEEELIEAFAAHGTVTECHLCLDKATRKSKGFAYVSFAEPAEAVAAMQALDGAIFQGRLLHVLPARKPPPAPEPTGKKDEAATFKQKREEQKKSDAGNARSWNALFMRQDTVAEAIAAHYGVTKAELYDAHNAADLPVRLALGETWVIAQTKRALEAAGCDPGALERAAAASGSAGTRKQVAREPAALLVKNLPYDCDAGELEGVFGAHGPLARLVLPETRTLAIVEYEVAQDARRAFKALAYKRLHHVPLYLEWAPRGVFTRPAQAGDVGAKAKAQGAKGAARVDAAMEAGVDGDAGGAMTSVYVKNVSFATTDQAFERHFRKAVKQLGLPKEALRGATIAKRKDKERGVLSKGFGFVECATADAAKALVRQLQGHPLDGHKLVLALSRGQRKEPGGSNAVEEGLSQTKLVVRNVAFQATKKDLLGLLSALGTVKDLRLPRKFDGGHRGFAFVEFSTKQEATAALQSLAGTHLYGRHLVLERAQDRGEEEEMEAARDQAGREVRGGVGALAAKRARLDLAGGAAGGEKPKKRRKASA
ncbi:unnamed protein product [Pedinophyceae sp. YPF-701]|nr:unnamed protein product [Pedinophyceae sp. YPF-701]